MQNVRERGRPRREEPTLSAELAGVLFRHLKRWIGWSRTRSRRPEILLVEDDPTVAGVLRLVLEAEEYVVRTADDIGSARLALTRPPDLVMLEISLPDGNGLDLLRHIRQDLALDIPVFVLSGLKQEGSLVRALEMGADEYVTKPFGPREILARVNRRQAS